LTGVSALLLVDCYPCVFEIRIATNR